MLERCRQVTDRSGQSGVNAVPLSRLNRTLPSRHRMLATDVRRRTLRQLAAGNFFSRCLPLTLTIRATRLPSLQYDEPWVETERGNTDLLAPLDHVNSPPA